MKFGGLHLSFLEKKRLFLVFNRFFVQRKKTLAMGLLDTNYYFVFEARNPTQVFFYMQPMTTIAPRPVKSVASRC